MKPIYFDHAATTPVRSEVIQAMVPVLEEVYGNPSSVHYYGRKARQLLDQARATLAGGLHANEKEIVFTSGGTESDNLAIFGSVEARKHLGNHIITTTVEHHAVLHAAEELEKEGYDVTYLPVDESGRVSIQDLEQALRDDTILVTMMYVNNETGIIQPIQEAAQLLANHQALFHTDAVQAFGTLEVDVTALGVDLLTITSHKINGPKGVGVLYSKEGTMLASRQHGGEQERKRRAGTENTADIHGFAKAVELVRQEQESQSALYKQYREQFIQTLAEQGVNYELNGDREHAVDTIVNISFPGTNVEQLLTNFDLDGIAASSGSACTAGSVEPSHVLTAMYGAGNDRTTNSIRFSFGLANTEENVVQGAEKVAKVVKRLSKTS